MEHHKLWVRLFLLLPFCFVFVAMSAATKKPPLKPININTANSEELQQVPGIGPATAEKMSGGGNAMCDRDRNPYV